MGAVCAGVAAVVAGRAKLVHGIVVIAYGADAVTVDRIPFPVFSSRASCALMPGQTAIAGVVALGTCYSIVIIVEILRTGAPSRRH